MPFSSPTRGSRNSFIDRYVNNVDVQDDIILKPLSPAKINASNSTKRPSINSNFKDAVSKFSNKSQMDIENSKENLPPFKKSGHVLKIKEPRVTPTTVAAKIDNSSLNAEQLKYYDFLCRVEEIKQWIESVIGETLPPAIELATGDSLRDGVFFGHSSTKINPNLIKSIFPSSDKLQFKHTQNINGFFSLVDHVGVPDSFRFELQDLYNKKDLPQVFETLNIMISIINKKWPTDTPMLQNLTNQVSFSKDDINKCKRTWPKIRNFKSLATSPTASPKRKADNLDKQALIQNFDIYSSPKRYLNDVAVTPIKEIPKEISYQTPVEETHMANQISPVRNEDTEFTYSNYRGLYDSRVDNNTIASPHLKYNELKMSSLSYHSPSISRYHNVSSEFFLRRSQQREQNLEYYQTYAYSPSRYSPRKRTVMSENDFLDKLIEIQSACRGVNTRFSLALRIRLANFYEDDILNFQSKIRGYSSRNEFATTKDVRVAQTSTGEIIQLQAYVKGERIRNKLDKLRIKCYRHESSIMLVQNYSKGLSHREMAKARLQILSITKAPLTILQANIKGNKIRKDIAPTIFMENAYEENLIQIQSVLKALLMRKELDNYTSTLHQSYENLELNFQSLCKGSLIRRKLLNVKNKAKLNVTLNNSIVGLIKANFIRLGIKNSIKTANVYSPSTNVLQGYIRGILVRYALDLVDDVVESKNIDQFQSYIRGSIVRSELNNRNSYFGKHSISIIKIQSWIRMFNQRSAFRDLMNSPNPSLWSVKKFVHLLNDMPNVEDLQNKLESNQAALDSANMKKEKLEKDMKQQMEMAEVLSRFDIDHSLVNKLSNVQTPTLKYGSFEKLFYLLQVEPNYWKDMYIWEPEFAKMNIYVSYSTVNQRMGQREKVYFMKLIVAIAQQNLSECSSLVEFLNSDNLFWQELLSNFLRREYPELIRLFIPVLDFLKNEEVEFTSDPIEIYRNIHLTESPTEAFAIEDSETSNKFISNLSSIWHAVELIAEIFSSKSEDIPHEIKYMCTKLYSIASSTNEDSREVLKMISKVLINAFCSEYLRNNNYYGFNTRFQESLDVKIEVLLKSLSTVFYLETFSGFYEPLNQYSAEIKPFLQDLLRSLMLDKSYTLEYDHLIYEDMLSSRPKLEILTDKVFSISKMFQDYSKFFPSDDIILDALNQCRDEIKELRSGRLLLELNTSSYRFLANDDKMKGIYEQVKRALIYMMQVEEVDTNLYDLAVSTVLPRDEPVFHDFIVSHPTVYSDDIVQDLESPKYFSLKNLALTLINELENHGILNSSENYLQDVLNDIAAVIKDPNYTVEYIQGELEVTKITLNQLNEFNVQINKDVQFIKTLIQQILDKFCASKNFTSSSKGTFDSIKDVYKKTQVRDQSSQRGLKFKWSTRQLYEAGVLKSIEGEKLGELTIKVFGSSGPKFPDINFKISTVNGKHFTIKMSDKHKGSTKLYHNMVDSFAFFDLLNCQVGVKVSQWHLFDSKVTFNTSELLKLISTNFYNREKDI
ncbi:hypothetical protein TPHA_0D03530 [Tetrapisispora phaffii CBS 4417]|uniref:Calponin-homology (CH) domain-containing protein n=1 Tax=Tetrapisispora phaffii (strain ATCC 24235 / CBS 4417 / NBRC 1672 / NRRL Y-8282 / UCD 70-5) TaxID=1071381 RepID=G8BT17_TETPH|nr:hypothetical protein TPHA_0D03530 [Tetrapisispora phaffii CBS 4417]CCE62988.1 hypothetical protein TPHA_0D03530 [Tetrapisispora phaffii CBS 4417]